MNFKYLFLGFALLLIFLSLLLLETRGIFANFDVATTTFFQTLIPRSLDGPLSLFSLLGNIEPTALLVVLIGLWIFRQEKRVYYPLVFFAVIAIFEFVGKFFLYHPGPPTEFFRFNLPFDFPHLYVKTSYSFPSGHVSRTIFIVVIGLFLLSKYLKNSHSKLFVSCILYLVSLVMVLSRIYLGEHWASDVLGGVLLGSSMALFAMVYY